MSSWWVGLSPAEAPIECGGQEHQLRWEHGAPHAPDHGDPDEERALAALAGQRFPCLDLLDAWERHRSDVRVLTLGSRGPGDPLIIDPGQLNVIPLVRQLTGPRRSGVNMIRIRGGAARPGCPRDGYRSASGRRRNCSRC